MKLKHSVTQKLMNILFYMFLCILIGFLILPHTSFGFKTSLFLPFSLQLNKNDIMLVKGESFKLRVVALNKRASFSTSDFKVCNVTINGRISAQKIGMAIIKVRVDDKELKCRVFVIDINKNKILLQPTDTFTLKIKGTSKRVRWSSSNKKIAVVNRYGKITAIKQGNATITATIKNKKIKCKLVVK